MRSSIECGWCWWAYMHAIRVHLACLVDRGDVLNYPFAPVKWERWREKYNIYAAENGKWQNDVNVLYFMQQRDNKLCDTLPHGVGLAKAFPLYAPPQTTSKSFLFRNCRKQWTGLFVRFLRKCHRRIRWLVIEIMCVSCYNPIYHIHISTETMGGEGNADRRWQRHSPRRQSLVRSRPMRSGSSSLPLWL